MTEQAPDRCNIYLDIDGVLLANDHHAALHVGEFVLKCIERGENLYWLTTWCRENDSTPAIRRLKQTDMSPATIEFLAKHCLPTHWVDAKTEAIDFTKPFLWFDDDCFTDERENLEEHGVFDNWIDVRLHEDEHHLQKFVLSFPLPIDTVD
jgi:hypothetical protein